VVEESEYKSDRLNFPLCHLLTHRHAAGTLCNAVTA